MSCPPTIGFELADGCERLGSHSEVHGFRVESGHRLFVVALTPHRVLDIAGLEGSRPFRPGSPPPPTPSSKHRLPRPRPAPPHPAKRLQFKRPAAPPGGRRADGRCFSTPRRGRPRVGFGRREAPLHEDHAGAGAGSGPLVEEVHGDAGGPGVHGFRRFALVEPVGQSRRRAEGRSRPDAQGGSGWREG